MTDKNTEVAPYRLLFVCTGNTCRSPMAEVIARQKLAELGWNHVEVSSAGVAAWDGSPASGGAVRAAGAQGLDLSGHVSKQLTEDAVMAADFMLTMSTSHLNRVVELGGAERAAVLTAFADGDDGSAPTAGVPDPIGGPDEEYQATFNVLTDLIARALTRLEPTVKP